MHTLPQLCSACARLTFQQWQRLCACGQCLEEGLQSGGVLRCFDVRCWFVVDYNLLCSQVLLLPACLRNDNVLQTDSSWNHRKNTIIVPNLLMYTYYTYIICKCAHGDTAQWDLVYIIAAYVIRGCCRQPLYHFYFNFWYVMLDIRIYTYIRIYMRNMFLCVTATMNLCCTEKDGWFRRGELEFRLEFVHWSFAQRQLRFFWT